MSVANVGARCRRDHTRTTTSRAGGRPPPPSSGNFDAGGFGGARAPTTAPMGLGLDALRIYEILCCPSETGGWGGGIVTRARQSQLLPVTRVTAPPSSKQAEGRREGRRECKARFRQAHRQPETRFWAKRDLHILTHTDDNTGPGIRARLVAKSAGGLAAGGGIWPGAAAGNLVPQPQLSTRDCKGRGDTTFQTTKVRQKDSIKAWAAHVWVRLSRLRSHPTRRHTRHHPSPLAWPRLLSSSDRLDDTFPNTPITINNQTSGCQTAWSCPPSLGWRRRGRRFLGMGMRRIWPTAWRIHPQHSLPPSRAVARRRRRQRRRQRPGGTYHGGQ